ncbi:MAG: sigma-54 dependent transcriptional regulator [Planctomycetota bacterium]|nr:sigma-54 dependent transcriptional regulator [Planctomycetota bacterium]
MEEVIRVLIVSRSEESAENCGGILERAGLRVFVASGLRSAERLLKAEAIDIVVGEHGIGGLDGERILSLINEVSPDSFLVLVTSHTAISSAIDLLGRGALAYVCHPPDERELVAAVKKAAERVQLRRLNLALHAELDKRYGFEGMVGSSDAMRRVFDIARQVADSSATVLIEGESGTGKEMLARSLHRLSRRSRKPFVAVACAALSESLLESELFGHKKGAFSDAYSDRTGRFEYANGGTLFLDEVGDIPLNVQAKLLRAIEQREIVPVGSNEPLRVDVRIIAASKGNLEELIRKGSFREDLYFRLRVVNIKLPPLRERYEDLPLLVECFVKEFSAKYQKNIKGVDEGVLKIFGSYPWYGNVRELRNCIESMVALSTSERLSEKQIPKNILQAVVGEGKGGLEGFVGRPLKDVEREFILATLKSVGGNRKKASAVLGIGERTLYRRLKEYGVPAKDYF